MNLPRPFFSLLSRILLMVFIAGGGLSAAAQDEFRENVRKTPWLSPAEEQKAFELPPGFEIHLVASEPQIFKPLNMAFDARGRLWITDTLEYPYAAAPDKPARDSIKILEDTNGDGTADKITTFAEGLNIPIGLLPFKNGVIAFSIPNIWYLEDTDNDGKADRKELLYGPFDNTRDTHGMQNAFRRGFDGWIYACHGFNNQSQVAGKDGNKVTMHSGNTYRFRSDGSRIEHYTFGQVNPFGMAFDPLFNIFTSDCHSKPIYQLLRGGYYPSFGRPDGGLGFVPEMMTHSHNSTAIDGCCFYEGALFPEEYRGNVLVGNVMTGCVNRDKLVPHGSTMQAVEQPDLLKTRDPWFRPADLQVSPDGALYIADFYNRIIGHYEVPLPHPGRDRTSGRIWKLSYKKSAAAKALGDLTKATVKELIAATDHHTLTVRLLATSELVDRIGVAGVEPMGAAFALSESSRQRVHLLWALQRLEKLTETQLQTALDSPLSEVRVHALKVLDQTPDWSTSQQAAAIARLADDNGFVKKAAAEALATHPRFENIEPLIAAWNAAPADDTHLIYAIRLALRDHLADRAVMAELQKTPLAEKLARQLAPLAFGLPTPDGASFLFRHLQRWSDPEELFAKSLTFIAQYLPEALLDDFLDFARGAHQGKAGSQVSDLKALKAGFDKRGASFRQRLQPWATHLVDELMMSTTGDSVSLAAEVVALLELRGQLPKIKPVISNPNALLPTRVSASQAVLSLEPEPRLSAILPLLSESSFPESLKQALFTAIASRNDAEISKLLATTMSAISDRQQLRVADALAANPAGAQALLSLAALGKINPRLLLRPSVQQRLQALKNESLTNTWKELTANLPSENEQLQKLIDQRRGKFPAASAIASIPKGAAHFTKNCAACHQVAGQGALVGPQLDGIGNRGWERLMEDILDPNRNVDVAFRTTVISLKNGKVVTGLLRREEGETLILADDKGKEFPVAKGEIDEQTRSQLSLMPANVAEILPEADFFDLLAYLASLRK